MKTIKIIKKEVITEKTKVYDIAVEGCHHYIFSNGIVSHNSFIPMNVVGGGSGIQYMSSIVIQMTKAQDKDGTETVGAIVTAKSDKNRFAKERSKIKFTINFNTGMNRYAGLLGFCEEEGLFTKAEKLSKEEKKKLTKEELEALKKPYTYMGNSYTAKELNKEFWDKEINGSLGEYMKNKFNYMSITEGLDIPEVEDED